MAKMTAAERQAELDERIREVEAVSWSDDAAGEFFDGAEPFPQWDQPADPPMTPEEEEQFWDGYGDEVLPY